MVNPTINTRLSKLIIGVLVGASVGLSGCSQIGADADDEGTSADLTSEQAAALKAAEDAVSAARESGQTPPASTSRPAVPGKRIAIVTISTDESGSVPIKAAQEAAKALGWETTVFNANHDISQISALVRRAVAAGYDGILPVVIDCSFAASAFKEAKDKGLVIVPLHAVDCDDPVSPSQGESGFSADISTAAGNDAGAFWRQAGVDAANKVIADSNNQARVVSVVDPELGILRAMREGFEETIVASGGSKIVETISFNTPDYVSGKVTVMVQTALAKHPEANYVKSPFTSATAQYIVPAVASHPKVKVVGGEGLPSELALIREGKLLATTTLPDQWEGWAAMDTFNSLFAGTTPVSSELTWALVDESNAPDGDALPARSDYESAYLEAWGK